MIPALNTKSILALCLFVTFAKSIPADTSLKSRPPDPTPTPVTVAVFVADIREIDGSKQLFSGDILIRLRWSDPRLAGPEKVRTVSINEAWAPLPQIVNRVSVQSSLPEILEVDHQGNVIYRQRYIGQFSTRMDLREFPLDLQIISVPLVVPGVSPSDVQFLPDPETQIMSELSITDWHIGKWTAEPKPFQLIPGGRSLAGFQFAFEAKRYFHFFLVQIIVPMGLILGMSWIVFWLDHTQPGPRISISITAMLTIVAYRLLLASFIPRLSFLTRMDYFVFGCTFLVFLSLVSVVIINQQILKTHEARAQKLNHAAKWVFPFMFVFLTLACFIQI